MGVEVVLRDVVASGIKDIDGTFDVITTFDSTVHWHHSPNRLFGEVVEKLKPCGVFLLGVPNRANLRKRIALLFGKGAWRQMQDWYETDAFRGHVREPDVDDLKYIAGNLGLVDTAIYGRNWLGYHSSATLLRFAVRIVDYPSDSRQRCVPISTLSGEGYCRQAGLRRRLTPGASRTAGE